MVETCLFNIETESDIVLFVFGPCFAIQYLVSFYHLAEIPNGIVSTKIYDKRDVFNFEIFNFPFLDGDVPRSPSYGVYISQLIRYARVCSHVDDFNNRNIFYF